MNHWRSILTLVCAALATGALSFAQATTPAATDPLKLNPATGCMEARFSGQEPDAQRTVTATAILESLRSGHCLRVDSAIIQGDVDLRALPVNGVDSAGGDLVSINGAFVVTHSSFSGALIGSKDDAGLRVRFKGPVVFSGSTFGELDLSEAQLEQEALFDQTQLGNVRFDRVQAHSINFRQARFDNPVFLTGMKVTDTLDLSGARFSSLLRAFGLTASRLLLDQANFETTTDFTGARVVDLSARGARFVQGVDFTRSAFQGMVDLEGVQCEGPAQFSESTFGGTASFRGAHFAGTADFAQTRFRSEVFFVGAVFEQTALFSHVAFQHSAHFTQAQFLAPSSFDQAQFLGWTDFRGTHFAALDLSKALFANSVGPDWDGATFSTEANLDGISSVGTWRAEQGQFKGSYEFLPAQRRFAQTLKLILLGATTAGVAVMLLMRLLQ